MKIGIITVHNGQNYGASLQAYALVKKLRNMGFDAYLVDYRTKKIEERLSSYRRKEKYNSFSNILKNLRSECSELLFDTSEYLKLVTERFEEFHQLILDVNSGEYMHAMKCVYLIKNTMHLYAEVIRFGILISQT